MPGGQVDDAEPLLPEAYVRFKIKASIIRSAVPQRIAHPFESISIDRLLVRA
jgi:hypothetical protein